MWNYTTCLSKLYNLNKTGGMKLGLNNIIRLADCFNNPQRNYRIVHIAGTNGKGSVSIKSAATLQSAGYRTGLYISPHIIDFRERISINTEWIPEDYITYKVAEIFDVMEREAIPATFFEVVTMLSFIYFAEENVDYAVIEVGLGGRLDATNIVMPELSVITQIGLDHCDVLGNTIQEIAMEKAGIIKEGVDCVVGPDTPIEVFTKVCEERKAPLYLVPKINTYETYEQENCRVATEAMRVLSLRDSRITPEAISQGIKARQPLRQATTHATNFSGQFTIIVDVGHNPCGLLKLLDGIQNSYPAYNIRVAIGMSGNKSLHDSFSIIAKYANCLHLMSCPHERLAHHSNLSNFALNSCSEILGISGEIEEILPNILDQVGSDEILVICGSFFIMDSVKKVFDNRGISLIVK
jgi:dihydrofolate synthase/folylpolyglutamate synthase